MLLPARITLSDFQSFDAQGASIEGARRFNIFVGPNNVGKSKLLQAMQRLSKRGPNADPFLIDLSGEPYKIIFTRELTSALAMKAFPSGRSGGTFGGDWWAYVGQHIEGSTVAIETTLSGSNVVADIAFAKPIEHLRKHKDNIISELRRHEEIYQSPFPAATSFFLAAERDVRPEPAGVSDQIEPNGVGVTRVIQRFMNSSSKNRSLVTKNLLDDLNEILHPQFAFAEIQTRFHENGGTWEIYLLTEQGRLVRLSQSGSGLKTILSLLANIHLKLEAGAASIDSGVFVFEELENSLHPRVQRNIYQYIQRKFTGSSVVLVSTHSPIAVDFFQSDPEAAFFQVSQEKGITKCKRIEAFDDRLGSLEALGVRASDALMSNFVIWVEGPSDRTYVNKFISLLSDGQLHEGREYSIMFYGGRLLSHLTTSEDDEVTELIRVLKINPKCAVLMDSDRASKGGHVNETKRRILDETTRGMRLSWLTKGREIENYVSPDFWARHFSVSSEDVSQYAKVFNAIEGKKSSAGHIIRSKVELAAFADRHAREHDLVLDWREKFSALVDHIRSANS